MRLVAVIALSLILVFLGHELYLFYGKKAALSAELNAVNAQIGKLETENKNLQSDITYYSDPKNLGKEARAQLNEKAPGEKMIIIVPSQ